MATLLAHLLVGVGIVLIVAGIRLAFRDDKTTIVLLMVLLGVLCCLADNPSIQNIAFKSSNFDISVTKQELDEKVENAAEDRQVDVIAPINLKLQAVSDSLAVQAGVNKALLARLDRLEASASPTSVGGPPTPPVQPDILSRNPTFLANNAYSILVFYRDSRKEDATTIVTALTTGGYQASSINTSLEETQVGPQPNDSTFIVPTDRGASIGDPVAKIIRATIPAPRNEAVTLGSTHALRRGDVQVYLY